MKCVKNKKSCDCTECETVDGQKRNLISAILKLPGESKKQKLHYFCCVALRIITRTMQYEGWVVGYGCEMRAFEAPDWKFKDEVSNAFVEYFKLVKMAEAFDDVLASVYYTLAWDKDAKKRCQSFTPKNLADGAQRFTSLNINSGFKANDFACGSGVLLLSFCKKADRSSLARVHIEGNDLDPLCAGMTALQLLANQVIHDSPIGRVAIECKDIIKDYMKWRPIVVCERIPYATLLEHEIRTMKCSTGMMAEAGGEA